ncbi:Transmembrane protein 54 [Lemmus lemmus]
MKTGLVLVVLGHVSFIAAAVLHGTMLRFVAAARDAVVLQYCVVDILSVTSAILRWTVFSLNVACALLSLTCALGLLASIAVTFATQGRALLAACTFESPERPTLAPDCPFDPTRIYSSSLCLWAISLMLCVAESVSALRCAQLVHRLLELRPWWGKSCHHTVSPLQSTGKSLLKSLTGQPHPPLNRASDNWGKSLLTTTKGLQSPGKPDLPAKSDSYI